MEQLSGIDAGATDRELLRTLRNSGRGASECMPENIAWQAWLELDRRGVPNARSTFISTLKHLHDRRRTGVVELSATDDQPQEHRLVSDPLLAELWRAYKSCLRNNRTGPAWHLLCDIERHIDEMPSAQ